MPDGIYTEAADASVFGKIERDKRLYDLKSLFGLGFKGFYKKTRVRVSVFPIQHSRRTNLLRGDI